MPPPFGRALAALALAGATSADLPLHCLHADVLGEWQVQLGAVLSNGDPVDGPPDCSGADAATGPRSTTARLTLSAPNVVTGADGTAGTWTMVYDEGWEATVGGQTFWGFLDYTELRNGSVVSHCGSMSQGTYHKTQAAGEAPTGWGCLAATKSQKGVDRMHAPPRRPEWADTAALPLPAPELLAALPRAVADTRADAEKYRGLPASIDWDKRGLVEVMRDQLNCGSCYAFGATSMIASRGRIAGAGELFISPQEIVSCGSFASAPSRGYAQGCDGGFGYLVAKYAADFGIAEDKCFPYESGIESVAPPCAKRCAGGARYRAARPRYVGGYFGNCSEVAMMQELVDNGPIAVGIGHGKSLLAHRSGIYEETAEERAARGTPGFEAVGHEVMIVGYGVNATGSKYWRVKNSWGRHFGDIGYFFVSRGTDEMSIESIAVAADTILPKIL